MKNIIAPVCAVIPLSGQFHAGVQGRHTLTEITEAQTVGGRTIIRNRPHQWTVGPMVKVDLPANLGIEFNALYRKIGYEYQTNRNPLSTSETVFTNVSDSVWDFPVLAKYRFPGDIARPYLGGGWTYRRLGDLLRFNSGSHGVVVGAGATIRATMLRISPEFRYTRWPENSALEPLKTRANQAEFLVGVTF